MLGPNQQAQGGEEIRNSRDPADQPKFDALTFEHLRELDANTVGAQGKAESDQTKDPHWRIFQCIAKAMVLGRTGALARNHILERFTLFGRKSLGFV